MGVFAWLCKNVRMDAPVANKPRVLMLDDEKFLLDLYRIVFERSGYEVTTFDLVDKALSALRSGYAPDVILFDITMPEDKSGYEFLETLNAEGLGKGAMKIALTNEGQEGEMQRLGELGADAHLLKAAYIPSQLAAVVTDSLQTWRSRKSA
jgi:CheY-like chemotaxis protein